MLLPEQPNGVYGGDPALLQLSRRVDFLSLLQQVDIELNHTLELNSVFRVALNAAHILSRADSGYIALLEGGALKISCGFGGYIEMTVLPNNGIAARAIRFERAEYLPDVSADTDYVALIDSTRAKIAIPLLAHHKIVGLLNLETDTPAEFTPDMVEFTSLLAGRIATAIENARLYQTSQAQLAELHALYQEVSALEQLKSDMIRIVSHDIRSPLAVIYSYIDLLNEDLKPHMNDQHRVAVSAIRRAVGRIQHMSSDILTLERLQSNTALPADTILVAMLMQRAVDDHYEESSRKKQMITLSVPLESLYVTGDQAQLREAITNLVGNAIKYTPEGGCINARLFTDDGCAVIEIEDNGYGIPEAEQSHLFEPFFRVRTKETRGIEGTGLGLYLVKKIIERHGGQIVWHSAYQVGSTFGFRLPLVG